MSSISILTNEKKESILHHWKRSSNDCTCNVRHSPGSLSRDRFRPVLVTAKISYVLSSSDEEVVQ